MTFFYSFQHFGPFLGRVSQIVPPENLHQSQRLTSLEVNNHHLKSHNSVSGKMVSSLVDGAQPTPILLIFFPFRKMKWNSLYKKCTTIELLCLLRRSVGAGAHTCGGSRHIYTHLTRLTRLGFRALIGSAPRQPVRLQRGGRDTRGSFVASTRGGGSNELLCATSELQWSTVLC